MSANDPKQTCNYSTTTWIGADTKRRPAELRDNRSPPLTTSMRRKWKPTRDAIDSTLARRINVG